MLNTKNEANGHKSLSNFVFLSEISCDMSAVSWTLRRESGGLPKVKTRGLRPRSAPPAAPINCGSCAARPAPRAALGGERAAARGRAAGLDVPLVSKWPTVTSSA